MSTALPPKPRIIGQKIRLVIVAAKYNEQFADALLENTIEELGEVLPNARIDLIRVPGAFEIPVTIETVLDRLETLSDLKRRYGSVEEATFPLIQACEEMAALLELHAGAKRVGVYTLPE